MPEESEFSPPPPRPPAATTDPTSVASRTVTTPLAPFSISGLIRKILLFGFLLLVAVEVALWIFVRAPLEPTAVIELENHLPGVKEQVEITATRQMARTFNWSQGDKPAGALRILCVGGSATATPLQSAADTWWGQLAAQLSAANNGARVEAAANVHWPLLSIHGARWVAGVALDLKPDIIVANLGASDVLWQPLQYQKSGDGSTSPEIGTTRRSGWKSAILKVSQIARWMANRWASQFESKFYVEMRDKDSFAKALAKERERYATLRPTPIPFRMSEADPRNEYLDALRILQDAAKAANARLVLTGEACLLQADMYGPELALCSTLTPTDSTGKQLARLDAQKVQWEITRFQEAARKFAEANQIPFFDLNTALPRTAENFVTELLLTDKGAAEAARHLLPTVQPVAEKVLSGK